MADEIIIETTSAEVIEVGVPGPQGPAGAAGTGLETLTTKGDTLYRGTTTGERLPIGATGEILRVSASGIPEWGSAPASGVSSVNGVTGAVTLDGSDIDTSGNDDLAAFVTYEFADGNGIYYPLPDSTLNNKRVYRTTTGHHVFFQSLRWHITDGSPITANIIESSDDDNAAWPWLSAWDGSIEKAQLSTVVGRARSTFLFVGDSIPNTSVSGLATVSASGDYDDLTGKPTIPTASTATPAALGTAAAGTSSDFSRADHVHAMPNASSLLSTGANEGDLPVAQGDGTVAWQNGTTWAALNITAADVGAATASHAASHAAAGSDALFDQDLNTTDYPTFLGIQLAGGDVTWGLNNILSGFGNSIDFENGIISSFGMEAQADAFRIQDPADPTKEARFNANGITTGTLREYTLPNADGTLALAGDAPASHSHGNINSSGQVGSTSGLPLVTTTAGAVTTLALGTAGQILRTKSDLSGVEFADPAAAGVTSVTGTAPIVSSGGTTPAISISAATTSAAGSMSSADKTKLDGIATGATANSSDATLLARANHTGTQAAGTITGLATIATSGSASDLGSGTVPIGRLGASGTPSGSTYLAGDNTWKAAGGVTSGSVDNAIIRADGTGGSTSQGSDINIEDATTTTANNVTISNQHSGQTNSSLVITGKGTGSLIWGPKPDGTATGGNARGSRAVDLQPTRDSAARVASGTNSFCIGHSNLASGTRSFAGGTNCTASAESSFAFGDASSCSGAYGGMAVGDGCSVTGFSSAAFGFANTSSGNYSFSAGHRNTASGASGAIALGANGSATINGQFAFSSGRPSASGVAQFTVFTLYGNTTGTGTTELFGGADQGGTVRLSVPSGHIMHGLVHIIGTKNDGLTVATYSRQVAIKNVGGTTSLVGSVTTVGADLASGTSISITANDTNDALKIDCTGPTAGETWRWTAAINFAQRTYAN